MNELILIEGKKNTGMALSSLALAFKMKEYFARKRVVTNTKPLLFGDYEFFDEEILGKAIGGDTGIK